MVFYLAVNESTSSELLNVQSNKMHDQNLRLKLFITTKLIIAIECKLVNSVSSEYKEAESNGWYSKIFV